MAGNPNVPQGTLNRLRASIVFDDDTTLNITAPYLAVGGISVAFQGDAGLLIPTLTGGVTSPEPYQMADVTINLVKPQGFADIYKKRIESNVKVGNATVYPDTNALSTFYLTNCILKGVREVSFDGNSAGLVITMTGIYPVNSAMWDL